MRRSLSLFLAITITLASSAQQVSTTPRLVAAVKRKVDTLAPNAPISVLPTHAAEEFGTFVSRDTAGFTFYDIDKKGNITLAYQDVRKIKDGYGGYNSFQGRHTDHTKALIVVAIAAGLIGGVIAAAAAAKN